MKEIKQTPLKFTCNLLTNAILKITIGQAHYNVIVNENVGSLAFARQLIVKYEKEIE